MWRRHRWLPLSLVAIVLTTAALGQTPSTGALLVLTKADEMMAIVDARTLQVLAKVPSGPDPHEIIATPDGKTAYISNYGASNTITPIDLTSRKTLPPIDLGVLRSLHGLAYAGGRIWFTAEAAKAIGSVDPATGRIESIVGTGQNRTHMIVVAPDLQRFVTSNVSSATLTIADRVTGRGRGAGPAGRGGPGAPGRGGPPAADWDLTIVPTGRGVEGFDVAPDGREIWTGNAQDGTISIVDAASKRVVDTLAANVTGANRLKFTPDGRLVFVSMLNNANVAVFDSATRTEVKRIPVGRGAAGIQMQPDGTRVFIACSPDNYVAVIDIRALEVIGRIDAGGNPDGMAWVGN